MKNTVLCITPIIKHNEENLYSTVAHVLPSDTKKTIKTTVKGKSKKAIFETLNMIELGLSV